MMMRFKLRLADHWVELVEGATIIGRDADATIVLDDDLVSRRHAMIEVSGGQAVLRDLDSRNGTFLNNQRVTEAVVLQNGDRIGIGDHVLDVRVQGQSEAQTEATRRPTLSGAKMPTMAAGPAAAVETREMDVLDKYVRLGRWRAVENLLKGRVAVLMERPGEFSVDHPKAAGVLEAMVGLAENTMSPQWIDRLFRLCLTQGWLLPASLRDRIYRVIRALGETGGKGLADYVSLWQDPSRWSKLGKEDQDRIRMLGELVRMYQRNR